MIHPLLEEDFSGVAPWFNEGFASLFEQSVYRDGSIKGLPNWRLRILKIALKEGKIISLKKLLEFDEEKFYGKGSDLHYAQARYLCLWMQEKGLLKRFYKCFKEAHLKGDKSGLKTIQKLFKKDILVLQKEWEEWVNSLKR
jgi:hypothetical protein